MPHMRCQKHGWYGSADGDKEIKSRLYDQARYHDEHRVLYRTSTWARIRKVHLQGQPLCVECMKRSVITPATDVDHIVPHRGDRDLFFDSNNLQSLCKACHTAKTRRGE